MPVQQGPAETAADRLRRAPKVLEAYANDIEKYGRPLDSGLPSTLRFVSEQIRALLSPDQQVTNTHKDTP